jgi:hypothetical protein
MPQLPCACCNEHHYLRDTIPHGSSICSLAQISVIRFPLPLILLFASDVLQLLIKVANLRSQTRDVFPVVLDISLCRANRNVKIQTDVVVTEPGSEVR